MAAPATFLQRVRVREDRYFLVKRLVDIALGLALFSLALPVMLLVGVLVALDTAGPVLYKQKRVGQNGVEFDLYKFRSMAHNADNALHRVAVQQYMRGERLNHERTTDAPFKLGNDPRVTRIGKLIRKTSLDELPQLWNIVIGDMSLVGPRPPVPYEVEMYSPRAMQRLDGKPGLTGPWQVYGRGTVTFSQMIEMDVAYLENRSIWYDLKLVILTAPAVLKGRGAA
ncbi:MAG TPA: sugar transferase [Ktedonobacterales bacterium]|jgi:lipopolysaccharide/colanic/teichoic acid biosynthesis glycosyltransferase|nr:sugar transferase [Ktedonobacterales bacterium]